jgi:hypothetical protein
LLSHILLFLNDSWLILAAPHASAPVICPLVCWHLVMYQNHRSHNTRAMHFELGFLVQNGEQGKGILTRGSLTVGWVPIWLAVVGTLLHSFGSRAVSFQGVFGAQTRCRAAAAPLEVCGQLQLQRAAAEIGARRRWLGQKWRLSLGTKST